MQPLEKIKQAFRSIHPQQDEEWEVFSKNIAFKHFEKGEFLCRHGQVENYIYFLNSGATRNYFIKDGKELTVDFQFEGNFVSAYYSFLSREPSPICVEAISAIEACAIHHESLHRFYDEYKVGDRIGRLIAEMQYMKRLKREIELMSMTAEERYARLVEQNPKFVNDLSVKHLSSYLGIHPESLSRIRKQYSRN